MKLVVEVPNKILRDALRSLVDGSVDFVTIVDFIEGFYNTRRRHSSIDYCSPVQFEKRQAVVA